MNKKLAYINSKLQELEGILYNEKSWSNFLNYIAVLAKKYNINIEYIKNSQVDSSESYGRVLDMELSYRADFSDVLSFLHELEQSELVTDIRKTDLVGDRSGGIFSNVTLSVWGINH